MTSVTLSLILEKISFRDKDFRYMATSDLANELAKPTFQFEGSAIESQVTTVVLNQVNDQSSDISTLATKCLGLLANKVAEDRLRSIVETLLENMVNGKKEQERDLASLGLKTVITELLPGKASVVTKAATPLLIKGLPSPLSDVAHNSLDVLIELASRHGAVMPDLDALRAALMPELDANRAGIRKRAIQCLSLLATYLTTPSLNALSNDIFSRLENNESSGKKDQTRTYIQTLGSLSKSVGYKLGPHMARAVPLVMARLHAADENDDELMELSLVALESFVHRSPADTRPFLDDILAACLQYMKFDPNYAMDDEEMDDGDGGGDGGDDGDEEEFEDDDDDEEEEAYSDDEDGSWKVRRAAAKLAAALVAQYPEVLQNVYRQVTPVLVNRFKEREEAVRPDIYAAYNDVVRAMGAAARRGDTAAKEALENDVPSVLKALAKQLKSRSSKTKSLALRSLQELVRAAPTAVVADMKSIVPGVKTALEDTSSAASALKTGALAFVNAALGTTAPAAFQAYAPDLAPAIFAAAEDRYYAVSAEALRACEQLVHVLRPECPQAVTVPLVPLVVPLFEVAAGRLAAQDLSLEVKEAAISCAAAAVAELGDVLEGESAKVVGSLVEEFAAMPKSRGRAAKRAKTTTAAAAKAAPLVASASTVVPAQPAGNVSQVLNILLERLKNETTRLTAVRAFATISRSPLPLDLTPILPQALSELTSFLRKANRQLRLAALTALTALVSRESPHIESTALESTVSEAAALVNDADLAVADLALRLVETVVKEQTCVIDAVCDKVLVPAVTLVGSPLLQGSVLEALQSLLAALAQRGSEKASFDRLLEMLWQAGTAAGGDGAGGGGGAPTAAARCTAALCHRSGEKKVETTVATLLRALENSATDDATRRFALLCIGELGRGSDLTNFPTLPAALTSSLSSEAVAEAASLALGSVASGNLETYLPVVLEQVRAQADDSKLQYHLLRALNEVIMTTAHKTTTTTAISAVSKGDSSQKKKTTRAAAATAVPMMAAPQVQEILELLLSSAAGSSEEECRAVVGECLGHLTLVAPTEVLSSLHGQLTGSSPDTRAIAVSALRHAAVEREHPVDAPLTAILPTALQLMGDEDVNVRKAGIHLLTAAAHNKPVLVAECLAEVLPLVYAQTKPDPALIRTVDLGPFKHKIDDGLELRKAAFECLGVLMARCYDRLDPAELGTAILDGLKDTYDVKMQCHSLLISLSHLAPGAVGSSLDRLVDPLTATLTARVKSDAVKQEVDRNEDMLRSCLRAVAVLNRLPSAANVVPFKQFMEGVVMSGAMKERYNAILAEKRQAEGGGGGVIGIGGGGGGGGFESMDVS